MMNMIDRCPSVFWLKWKLRAIAYWQWTLPSIHCLKGIGNPDLPARLASFALSHSVPKGNAHPNFLHFGRRQLIITFHIQFSIHSNLLSASLAINYWISLINVNTDRSQVREKGEIDEKNHEQAFYPSSWGKKTNKPPPQWISTESLTRDLLPWLLNQVEIPVKKQCDLWAQETEEVKFLHDDICSFYRKIRKE